MAGGGWSGAIQSGSSGSGLIGGIIDIGAGFGAATKAFKRTRQMYRNRYQWTAKDLEAAGLNRVLALTQGPGASSGVSQPAQLRGGMSEAARGAALLRAQLAQISASTAKTLTETKLLEAGVPTAEAKEDVLQWFFNQLRSAVRGGTSSAKDLLSPEARETFGMSPREKYGPIKIVPKGEKYKGEKR